ncbi:hypothetical protein GCM10010252_19600 [Streptomyces aureoverticillatus]|nr:hypothetical protein GCM10010252_19600 [Streptomyces aureoverticillatus]
MRIVEAVVGAVGSVGAVGAAMVLGAAAPAVAAEEPPGEGLAVSKLAAQESFDGVPGKEILDGSALRSLPIRGLPIS